jgi:hypothetical protein
MSYIIIESKAQAIVREQQLTEAGIKAGYFPANERYDVGGLVIMHPLEDKAAIEIYKFAGLATALSLDNLPAINCEPLFTEAELANKVEILTPDWM